MIRCYFILLFFSSFFVSAVYAQTFDDTPLLQNTQKFLEDKQYDNAIIELNKILDADPDNVNALNEKGKIRLIQGKYVKALQNFEKTLQSEPKNIVALNGLGTSQFHLNQYEDSLDSFNSVLSCFIFCSIISAIS